MNAIRQWKFVGIILFCLVCVIGVQGLEAAPSRGNINTEQGEAVPHVIVSDDDALPKVTARSAVIVEAMTGKVLYSRDMKARRFPASTTKMMTLIVALERGNLDDIVTISPHAAGTEGSTLWLEEGDKIPLRDLLYGMMMMSGNDATIAVAEHIAGSVEAFAGLMNQKAEEIGAKDTHFMNPNGLPDERHYSTAYDLALIASYGYRNAVFAEIVGTKELHLDWIKDPKHMWRNENQILWLSDGANGVKTGYTDAAGRCLAAGAKRDGIQIVSVVLDSLYMWNDSIAMLDYGFQQVDKKKILHEQEHVGSLRVRSGYKNTVSIAVKDDIVLPVFEKDSLDYQVVYDIPESLEAPIQAGDPVGNVRVLWDGREIAATEIVATETVEKKSFFLTVLRWIQELLK